MFPHAAPKICNIITQITVQWFFASGRPLMVNIEHYAQQGEGANQTRGFEAMA